MSNIAIDNTIRRWSDAFQFFCEARETYFEPNKFRANIQSCLMQIRSVTLILQKNHKYINDFYGWYQPWQEKMRSDKIMKWALDTRNEVSHACDLEKESILDIKIRRSYLETENPFVKISSEDLLFFNIDKIKDSIPSSILTEETIEIGVLEISRQWIANTLPDSELLDAISHVLNFLNNIIDDLFKYEGIEVPKDRKINSENIKSFFINDNFRVIRQKLKDAEFRSYDLVSRTITREEISEIEKIAEAKYKNIDIKPKNNFSSFEELCDYFFSNSIEYLKVDGKVFGTCFLINYDELTGDIKYLNIVQCSFKDKSEKFLFMQRMARELKIRGGNAFVIINEAWTRLSYDGGITGQVVLLNACNVNGDVYSFSQKFDNEGENIKLIGEPSKTKNEDEIYILNPILNIWGKGYDQVQRNEQDN